MIGVNGMKRILLCTFIFLFAISITVPVFATEELPADTVLKKGDSGLMIQHLQIQLQSLGYYSDEITGNFGDVTKKSVSKFQAVNELPVDGAVGSITWDKLFDEDVVTYQAYVDDINAHGGVLKIGSEGEAVVNLQMRLMDLGYYNYKVTGYYGAVTRDCVATFQRENGLTVDGTIGPDTSEYLYSVEAQRKLVIATPADDYLTISRGGSNSMGEMLDWFTTVQYIYKRGSVAKVTDVYTGKVFYMKRTGGSYHADVEPVTAQDTATMFSCYGGTWSWTRRPIIVEIDGLRIAASMNGMPHAGVESQPGGAYVSNRTGGYGYGKNGDYVKGNNMSGQTCIHFYNSKTHVGNKVDPSHAACVRIAAGKN